MSKQNKNIIRFEDSVNQFPKNIFIKSKNLSLSYFECNHIANSFSSHLVGKIHSGELITVIVPNSPEFVIIILTLWKLGAVPVPVNPSLTRDDIMERINFCGIKKAFCTPSAQDIYDDIEVLPFPDLYKLADYKETSYTGKVNETAVMIFTSGSAGKPKCVEITFDNLISNFRFIKKEFNINNNDSWLVSLPTYHIGGFAIISRAILANAALYFPESLNADDLLNAVQTYKPKNISFVSPTLYAFVEKGSSIPKECKNIFVGGGKIDREIVRKAIELEYPMHLVYGMTETTSMICKVSNEMLQKNINSGAKIFDGVEVKIITESYNKNDKNKIGEVIIRSPSVAKGYFNNIDDSQKSFVDDFTFASGDLGYIDKDGMLHIIGRKDDVVISGGENVNTLEVEQKIKNINGVKDCAVFGMSDTKWGDKIIAAIVKEQFSDLTENQIRNYAKENLPNYQVPKEIIFVNEIPRSEIGKLKKEKLVKVILSKLK